jgi:undecaprenyl-diphosphatase
MSEPMTVAASVALGAIQGATEFLPVSSDGHLATGAFLFGITDMSLTMVVLLHAGTLLATVIALRADVLELLRAFGQLFSAPRQYAASDEGKETIGIVVASIPTAMIGLVLEDAVESWAHVPWIVGVCLLGSAVALFATRGARGSLKTLGPGRAALIGIAQGLAVLPGLSRSGCTMASAMLLGMAPSRAFRFSFLLSLPSVGGAIALKLVQPGALAELNASTLIGACTAFVVGLFALALLRGAVGKGRVWMFGLYLVPLGIAVTLWGMLR